MLSSIALPSRHFSSRQPPLPPQPPPPLQRRQQWHLLKRFRLLVFFLITASAALATAEQTAGPVPNKSSNPKRQRRSVVVVNKELERRDHYFDNNFGSSIRICRDSDKTSSNSNKLYSRNTGGGGDEEDASYSSSSNNNNNIEAPAFGSAAVAHHWETRLACRRRHQWRRRPLFGNDNNSKNKSNNNAILATATTTLVSRNSQDRDSEEGNENSLQQEQQNKPKMWPPWPFNLLSQQPLPNHHSDHQQNQMGASYRLAWSFTRVSARVSFRNLQHVCSKLWFHMPPAGPPLLILAAVPLRQRVIGNPLGNNAAAAVEQAAAYKTVIPLLRNPFARNLALASVMTALASWANSELHRRNRRQQQHLSWGALPLAPQYRDIRRAILPPFLPERVPLLVKEGEEEKDSNNSNLVARSVERTVEEEDMDEEVVEDDNLLIKLHPELRRHWNQFRDYSRRPRRSLSDLWHDTRQMRQLRRRERKNEHRRAIFDELVALQVLKQKALAQQEKRNKQNSKRKWYKGKNSSTNGGKEKDDSSSSLGYALVTGASKGIGRALAVELARWEIPLILVARNVDRLTALAYDLEACYGVPCCVLKADLSKPDAAERVYEATTAAGLQVDILINNAGFAAQGMAFDVPLETVQDMIQLNAVSVATLTHLYGRDMKERRRGRIMIMSSVCGAVAGLPTVSVYAATKAYANSLSISLAKELEPYGVGVTSIRPGAVRDTAFKDQSHSSQALCWKIPFYCLTPSRVAAVGVRALLRGDTEVTPGLLNRIFVKVLQPMVPPRVHNMIAELVWNPWPESLTLPFPPGRKRGAAKQRHQVQQKQMRFQEEELRKAGEMEAFDLRARQRARQSPPMLLQLKEPEPEPEPEPEIFSEAPVSQAAETTVVKDHEAMAGGEEEEATDKTEMQIIESQLPATSDSDERQPLKPKSEIGNYTSGAGKDDG